MLYCQQHIKLSGKKGRAMTELWKAAGCSTEGAVSQFYVGFLNLSGIKDRGEWHPGVYSCFVFF